MLDLPLANLDGETLNRASSFFRGIPMSGPAPPTRQGSYQVDFMADAQGIREASGLGVAGVGPGFSAIEGTLSRGDMGHVLNPPAGRQATVGRRHRILNQESR
jgi:hypothetical protein